MYLSLSHIRVGTPSLPFPASTALVPPAIPLVPLSVVPTD